MKLPIFTTRVDVPRQSIQEFLIDLFAYEGFGQCLTTGKMQPLGAACIWSSIKSAANNSMPSLSKPRKRNS